MANRAMQVVAVDPSVGYSIAPVRDQLSDFGFAVLQFPTEVAPEVAIASLAERLGLGNPYIPALYRQPETSGFSAALSNIEHDERADHPGFATRSGQPWHVDGTLEDIGAIRTSVLYCVHAAQSGGHTRLFNAVAAFHALKEADPEAAQVLLMPSVLRRISTILSEAKWNDGPAFSENVDGSYLNRFSEGATACWNTPEGKGEELDRALSFLRAKAEESIYTASILLRPGQCLVFRNDQVSHSREEYVDDPKVPRKLIRALFEQAPA
jgi:alpha-ketoglutarate-dependent taurine dioxygenase